MPLLLGASCCACAGRCCCCWWWSFSAWATVQHALETPAPSVSYPSSGGKKRAAASATKTPVADPNHGRRVSRRTLVPDVPPSPGASRVGSAAPVTRCVGCSCRCDGWLQRWRLAWVCVAEGGACRFHPCRLTGRRCWLSGDGGWTGVGGGSGGGGGSARKYCYAAIVCTAAGCPANTMVSATRCNPSQGSVVPTPPSHPTPPPCPAPSSLCPRALLGSQGSGFRAPPGASAALTAPGLRS